MPKNFDKWQKLGEISCLPESITILPKIPASFNILQVNTLQIDTSDWYASPFLKVG